MWLTTEGWSSPTGLTDVSPVSWRLQNPHCRDYNTTTTTSCLSSVWLTCGAPTTDLRHSSSRWRQASTRRQSSGSTDHSWTCRSSVRYSSVLQTTLWTPLRNVLFGDLKWTESGVRSLSVFFGQILKTEENLGKVVFKIKYTRGKRNDVWTYDGVFFII